MIKILDVPLGAGGSKSGCERAPGALRGAGLVAALRRLGHAAVDLGAVESSPAMAMTHPNRAIKALATVSAWTRAIADAAFAASADAVPVFLGGDHSISAGTIAGMARRADAQGRPLFVLWIDAHPDFHTLATTETGNLHGVPLAYVVGLPGFAPWFPALIVAVDPRNVCTLGTRNVDPAESDALAATDVTVHGMAAIETHGIVSLVEAFLDRVAAANGLLHVSFDIDVLDPSVAPAVGTRVAGGVSLDDARRLMETLGDSGLVTSLDVVELNPTLDTDGRTASLAVDLVARSMGREARAQKRA